jgi:hypothetical protein
VAGEDGAAVLLRRREKSGRVREQGRVERKKEMKKGMKRIGYLYLSPI